MDKTGYGNYLKIILAKMGKQAVGLTLAPSLLVLLIALFFGWGLQTATIAVSVQDKGFELPGMGLISIPDQMIAGLDKKVFHVVRVSNQSEAYRLVDEGKASIGLFFPNGLTQDLMIKQDDPAYEMKTKIGLTVDKSNPIVLALTAGKLVSSLAKNAPGFDVSKLPIPVDLSAVLKGGPPNIGAFVMSGLFIFLLFIISVMATVTLTMKLKTENPELRGGKANLVFIKIFTVVYLIQAVLLFLTGMWVFHVNIPGNIALASLSILLLAFSGASFGTMYSSLVKKADQVAGAALFAILPIFLCGILFPLEMVPGWLRWLSYALPPFYAVKSFRGFTLYNSAQAGEWTLLGILLLIGIVFLVISVLAGNKNKKEA